MCMCLHLKIMSSCESTKNMLAGIFFFRKKVGTPSCVLVVCKIRRVKDCPPFQVKFHIGFPPCSYHTYL